MADMSSARKRTANLLGALALGLSDHLVAASEAGIGLGVGAPAALVIIGTTPGLSIDALRRGLRLTHSAAVRTVMKLTAAGLVAKAQGQDGRVASLTLTKQGTSALARLYDGRRAMIERLLNGLTTPAIEGLERALDHALTRLPVDVDDTIAICRLCEEAICPQDRCPVVVGT